jgi:hypothetical protein
MKIKRAKAIRRHLHFYRIEYGLRPPYRIASERGGSAAARSGWVWPLRAQRPSAPRAVDGDFIQAALEGRIQLKEQFPKLMQDETTPCMRRGSMLVALLRALTAPVIRRHALRAARPRAEG